MEIVLSLKVTSWQSSDHAGEPLASLAHSDSAEAQKFVIMVTTLCVFLWVQHTLADESVKTVARCCGVGSVHQRSGLKMMGT